MVKLDTTDNMEQLAHIKKKYVEEIRTFNVKNIMQLELSQYLEKVLWPHYNQQCANDKEMIISIVAMVNEKFREHVSVWDTFQSSFEHFSLLFTNVCLLILNENAQLDVKEKINLLVFLIHCFNSVEVELVRLVIQKYISMPIWTCLTKNRLESEFKKVPKLKKFWKKLEKNDQKLSEEELKNVQFERMFLYNLIFDYFQILSKISTKKPKQKLDHTELEWVRYCERFLELLIDLEALLPTRRFFNALLDDLHVITISRLSNLHQRQNDGKLFGQLLENLQFYAKFEIDDVTGEELSDSRISSIHFDKMNHLQKVIYKLFSDDSDFRPLYLASISSIDSREKLLKYFSVISEEKLTILCNNMGLGLDNNEQIEKICSFFNNITRKDILLEILIDKYERTDSQLKKLNSMPLYPSEEIIWDENVVPSQYYSGDGCLALPKLNIQFLTMHDYLLRNFHLFRLESTYEIRQDIESAVAHLKPWRAENGSVMFGGWARMAIPIDSFSVTEIGKCNIGEDKPTRIRAEVVVNLNVKRSIKAEWESLRKHDVCFLVTVMPEVPPGTPYNYNEKFIPQVGLVYVRGCEIEGLLDPHGRLIDENLSEKPTFDTDFRTYRVLLDTNQFKIDTSGNFKKTDSFQLNDVYDSFNILVRRKPKENNFKAVLETIRDLMNTRCVVPDWLHDVILGYGDPNAAHYSNLEVNNQFTTLDFFDSFLNYDHLVECFPSYKVICSTEVSDPKPPFKLQFDEKEQTITVYPYEIPNRGPYLSEKPKLNQIRFTSTQVEVLRAGVQHGLTMVVGPPGTGKTDLAVQIISTLYHNFPEQRTLIVTHSNQALNAMFEKIMALDIDERHLLRLGHGEEQLETDKDFSRYGRVNYVLAKRLELLDIVAKLAQSFGLNTDVAYTCETAGYFFLYHVLSKWEAFLFEINKSDSKHPSIINEKFPFSDFFSDVQPLFKGNSFEEDFNIAKGCFRYIKKVFTQIDEFKAFEMLRSGSDRANYLLVREAKIIAMTCTHAALKRKELSNLMFQYDNILMEESAQILEIETFIPLLLQNPEFGHNRLKRWIMIGDHLQLPPVIKNMSFQKFSNMEQSLFTRFVRLGVPTIYLDAQGRAKPSISELYSWRYQNLGNLKHILELKEFQQPNPGKAKLISPLGLINIMIFQGFVHDYQLINVEDFNGVGESEPIPYFYQVRISSLYLSQNTNCFVLCRILQKPNMLLQHSCTCDY